MLSEGSYVRSTTRAFPQRLVAERLSGSLCLFVGLSMTDPNFIRWLYNSAAEHDANIASEAAKWAGLIRKLNLKVD